MHTEDPTLFYDVKPTNTNPDQSTKMYIIIKVLQLSRLLTIRAVGLIKTSVCSSQAK